MTLSDIWFGVAAMLQLPPEVERPTLQIYDPASSSAMTLFGPTVRTISGLLSLPPQRSGILDGNYLATMDGLAVLTAANDAIATQPLRVVSLEEHILTSAGDVIVV